MTRRVVPTNEVLHFWAHQSQDSARNSSGSVYFEGATCYSYGNHFPMATIHANGKGKLVLTNPDSYSVTTSSHQTAMHRACSHLSSIAVPYQAPASKREFIAGSCETKTIPAYKEHKANMQYLVDQAIDSEGKRQRARVYKDMHARDVINHITDMERYAEFFGYKPLNHTFSKDDYQAMIDSWQRVKAQREETARKKRAKAEAQKLERWLQNDTSVRCLWNVDVHLRVVPGEHSQQMVETTKGARFSARDAKAAFLFALSAKRKDKAWVSNGDRFMVGAYPLTKISADGDITAGCHFIKWAQIINFAIAQGWAPNSERANTLGNT